MTGYSFHTGAALRGRPDLARPAALLAGAGGAAFLAGWLLTVPSGARVAIAITVGVFLASLGLAAPRALLFALILWLAALGLVRRLVTELAPIIGHDPLLLVGPLAIATLAVAGASRGAFRVDSRLAKAVLLLSSLAVLGAFNPLQGSLSGGLAGLLFFLVPMLAFWAGRGLCDDRTLEQVLLFFAALSVPAALYGLLQTFQGFPSWDLRWIEDAGYTSLQVHVQTEDGWFSTTRAFASFSSASEYAYFLAIGLLVWVVGSKRIRLLFAPMAIGLLGIALVYQSSRGIVVVLFATAALVVSARARLRLGTALVLSAALLLSLPLLVRAIAPTTAVGDDESVLIEHQVQGLANPLDDEASTLGVHFQGLVRGIRSAFTEPLGLGTGAVSIAGSKFGGASKGTEADPSNAAVALGLPGLVAYLAVLVLGFARTYSLALRRRDTLGFLALGLLTLTTLQWLNGGQYAVAFLPWLILGWVDRRGPPPEPEDEVT